MSAADEYEKLNQWRQYAVYGALGLLVFSIISPGVGLAVLRSLAWGSAGVLSLLCAAKARQAGAQAGYGNAILYFAVAVIPLLKGR